MSTKDDEYMVPNFQGHIIRSKNKTLKRAKYKSYKLIWLRDQRRGLMLVLKHGQDFKGLQGAGADSPGKDGKQETWAGSEGSWRQEAEGEWRSSLQRQSGPGLEAPGRP